MDLVWLLVLGLLIGAVLGGLGGGGAILTVPALVYLVGESAEDATTSSLVIVGLTSAVGVLSYVRAERVHWKLGLTFGAVGLPATWLGSFLNHRVDGDALLLGFSVLMLIAAGAMVLDGSRKSTPEPSSGKPTQEFAQAPTEDSAHHPGPSGVAVVVVALVVGLLTGFFGIGGGFIIVPALVLVLRIPMHRAVGTSLLIVALNSATALASRAGTAHFDWQVIVPFTLAAMVATLAGKRVADRLAGRGLQVGFAILLVLVAGYTAWQSIAGLT